jgi:hypothetical protein
VSIFFQRSVRIFFLFSFEFLQGLPQQQQNFCSKCDLKLPKPLKVCGEFFFSFLIKKERKVGRKKERKKEQGNILFQK